MSKYVVILFSIFLSFGATAQTNSYAEQWKEVKELSQKRKSKDAEALIRNIMSKAKKEKNKEQIIKSLILLRQAVAERDEKEGVNTILEFEKEIEGLAFPEKNIMHSMIASLYNSYYQQHQYEIYLRTEIANPTDLKYPDNIETWTPQLFFNKIQEQFDASILNPTGLQNYSITQFPELIQKGANAEKLRPTLFDVLVHRAIDYFQNDEIDITKASYFFKLKDPKAFASAEVFVNAVFKTEDNFSTKYLAISYLQLATRFHLADAQPDALIDLETKRLQFVFNHYDGLNSDSLYQQALEKLIERYNNNATIAQAYMKLAEHKIKTEKPVALALVRTVQEKFPTSIEMQSAQRLEQQILEKSLNITTEKADVQGKNILALLSFKNIETAHFKIIPLSYEEVKSRERNYQANNTTPKGKSIKDWTLDLKKIVWQGATQYETHQTEAKIESLPTGHYAIMVSGDATFDETKSPISYSLFQVCDISYAVSGFGNNNFMFVLNRETGAPIANATVYRYEESYDYNSRQNALKKIDAKKTDANGRIIYTANDQSYHQYHVEIEYNNQKLWAHNAFYGQRQNEIRDYNKLFLFTDRAIYRPGQTIYFKGLYVNSAGDNRAHNIVANKEVEVKFIDANYKEVTKITLTTNEFGSINGTFTAPEGLLNGRFTIQAANGSKQIRVEEYKRPKFEVVIDPLEKNVKLNDQVNISGQAKAYAGNGIDGAQVKYIVRRKVRWPYYWCFYFWGAPQSNQDIIVQQGEAITDDDGKFEITFMAEDDGNIDARTKPFYDFEVSADVTDLNGETRTGKKTFSISDQSLILSVDMPSEIEFNQFNSIAVKTTNIEGNHTAADVKLEFIKLAAPSRFLKKRLWQAPDENLLTLNDFNQYFADYEYKNESNPLFWKDEKTIWTKTIRTEDNTSTYLQKIAPEDGYYMLKASSHDKDNQLIEEKKVVRLINLSTNEAQTNEALFTYLSNKSVEPGEKTSLSVSSIFKDAHIYKSISRQQSFMHSWDQRSEAFSIEEKDRGGFMTNFFIVRGNRLYQENIIITVPWTNKDLSIAFETFRDKILPGSHQEWKIKISGNKKEKVSAELLAAMYDASLDAFEKNNWDGIGLYQNQYQNMSWLSNAFGIGAQQSKYKGPTYIGDKKYKIYPSLNMFGLNYGLGEYFDEPVLMASEVMRENSPRSAPKVLAMKANSARGEAASGRNEDSDTMALFDEQEGMLISKTPPSETSEKEAALDEVHVRANLNETAFFFPDLQTDKDGQIILSFTAPEALTRWNIKTLAHTKDMKTAFLEKSLVTQKELMLTPNHPRFMREGDKMVYSSKLSNLSDKKLNGTARLEILNAQTEENINVLFGNLNFTIPFNLAAGKSTELTWNINIPQAFTEPVIVRIVAKADEYSDGEQIAIPLLLNSMLVTETMPLPVRANTTKYFKFEKLLQSGSSSTLKNHKLTVEYTSNPAWYAVQALPYLTDYPYQCAEQTFNRYYANALAAHIANSSPKIQQIFSQWQEKDTLALLSNLEKNQELKSALLQETPWVLDADNETAQKKMIANLFNLNRMSKELSATLIELEKLQTPNGGFAWFKGMQDNPFITQYIITGIARLRKLGVQDALNNKRIETIVQKAIPYLDARTVEHYNYLKKENLLKNQNLDYQHIQYMYMRSFFPEKKMNDATKTAFDYYKEKGKKHWPEFNKYMQGMLAIIMHRKAEAQTAQDIIEALRQNAIHSEEMGMYYKELSKGSYWWYQAPIEAQALLIEAFKEVAHSNNEVNELKVWLLKQKQTQQWKTTKATADACYALLLEGTDFLAAEPQVNIKLGKQNFRLSDYKQEAGTGYTKFSLDQQAINPDMGNIQVTVTADQKVGTTWGAVYWQYFEQLDKITEAETPLSLKKQVYKVIPDDRGEKLVLLKNNEELKVGDKVKIRIELRVDRAMEFVHMKDMRGACFEPTNVLSNYKYQNGLGYYESTKDASTQFFFDNLRPGTYIFEYPMFATLRGDYSNGITTIQCMYAPEFSSHSEGIRVKIK